MICKYLVNKKNTLKGRRYLEFLSYPCSRNAKLQNGNCYQVLMLNTRCKWINVLDVFEAVRFFSLVIIWWLNIRLKARLKSKEANHPEKKKYIIISVKNTSFIITTRSCQQSRKHFRGSVNLRDGNCVSRSTFKSVHYLVQMQASRACKVRGLINLLTTKENVIQLLNLEINSEKNQSNIFLSWDFWTFEVDRI